MIGEVHKTLKSVFFNENTEYSWTYSVWIDSCYQYLLLFLKM